MTFRLALMELNETEWKGRPRKWPRAMIVSSNLYPMELEIELDRPSPDIFFGQIIQREKQHTHTHTHTHTLTHTQTHTRAHKKNEELDKTRQVRAIPTGRRTVRAT